MNKIWKYTLLVLVLFVFSGMQSTVHAECGGATPNFFCDDLPPNPSLVGIQEILNNNDLTINVLPGAGIDTDMNSAGRCIAAGNGNNNITVSGGNLLCQFDGIGTLNGNNNILIENSTIRSTEARGIFTGNGDDVIEIKNSIIDPGLLQAIVVLDGNDTVILGTGADIRGVISDGLGSDQGLDTLVFQMEVFPSQIHNLCSEIDGLDPIFDSITINGLFYEWFGFNELECDLQPMVVTRDVPTLSEWGLIAMAAILGMVGFIVIRRRQAIA